MGYIGQDREAARHSRNLQRDRHEQNLRDAGRLFDAIGLPGRGWAPSRPSVLAGCIEWLGGVTEETLEWCTPLGWLRDNTERLVAVNWKLKLTCAVIGALAGLSIFGGPAAMPSPWPLAYAWVAFVAGDFAVPVGVGLAALAGWFAMPMAVLALSMTAALAATLIGVGIRILILTLAYLIVAAVAGLPPF